VTRARPGPAGEASYRAALDRLYARRRFGLRPGLEVIRALLEGLEHPERSFRALHVTGSKGKGSVAAMAARLLEESGRRTGLYTSPHLVSYRERLRVNGRLVPRPAVVDGVARIEALADALRAAGRIDRPPTFFEVTTALAFDWFRAQKVTDAVVEVGIGGRLDATNVLGAPIGVITTIELEHTDLLGPTLSDIAGEKAGIWHAGSRGIVGALPAEARKRVDHASDELGVGVWHLEEEIRLGDRELAAHHQRFDVESPAGRVERVTIPLLGAFQAQNAALAIAAVQAYCEERGPALDPEVARRALRTVEWRGRLEQVRAHPPTYLDVAHTPESAHAIAAALGELHPYADPAQSVLLFGCLEGKRVELMLDALAPLASTIVVSPVRSERALDPATLRHQAVGRFPRVVQATDAAGAYALGQGAVGADGLLLVAGSDYLVGELLRALEGGGEDEPDLSDPGIGEPDRRGPRAAEAAGVGPGP
jgi:dihydrofolate synthase / folylpolyglutamate synthase